MQICVGVAGRTLSTLYADPRRRPHDGRVFHSQRSTDVYFAVLDEVEEVEHRCREMVEKIAEYTGEDIEQLLQR